MKRFSDGLGDRAAGALGDRVQHGELCLHVGRERRVGAALMVTGFGYFPVMSRVIQSSPFSIRAPASSSLTSTASSRLGRCCSGDLATGHGGAHQEGAGLDAIGLHAVAATVQTFYAVDGQGIGAGALDLGTRAR